MKTIPEAIALLKEREGLRLEAYQDGGGKWTIGYGETQGVKPGMVITKDRAEMMFIARVAEMEGYVNKLVKAFLNPYQFSALVCLVYNIGPGAFARSTLRRLLNLGMYEAAADQFPRWCKDNGKVERGLVIRRQKGGMDFSAVPLHEVRSLKAHLREIIRQVEHGMYVAEDVGCHRIQFQLSDLLDYAETIQEALNAAETSHLHSGKY